MKALILILTLMLSMQVDAKPAGSGRKTPTARNEMPAAAGGGKAKGVQSKACSALAESEVNSLIKLGREVEDELSGRTPEEAITMAKDWNYEEVGKESAENRKRLVPIDFKEKAVIGSNDADTLGQITFTDRGVNGPEIVNASGVKVGKHCIATSAHVFDYYAHNPISSELKEASFKTASGDEYKLTKVLATMDREGEDFTIEQKNGKKYQERCSLS